jgi:hypothetical protein
MDLEKNITLKKPIKIGDQDFLVLNLREPTAAELSKAASAKNNVEAVIELVSVTAKVPRLVAEGMGARDFKECDRFFAQFAD